MSYADTHREIVERCQKGERRAQFELYQLYSRAMYNICLRMVHRSEDAEDMLQQSFSDVFHKLHYFRFDSSIGAWIKRITINNCINYLKKRKLDIVPIEDRQVAAPTKEPTIADHDMDVKAINEAVRQLPDGYRVVFTLYAFEGYDHLEIADILGITASTSKSQYSRARARIKQLIAEAQPREGGMYAV